MSAEAPADTGPAPLAVLLDNHRAFLGYLERRVGDRAMAEDILQDAFARAVERPEILPSGQALVRWFYGVLRNATIDRFRRQGTATRALESFARELERQATATGETEAQICGCISRLAGTLAPAYADALRSIEIEGMPVKEYAVRHGLSAGTAAVRVHRARTALRKRVVESCGTCAEHGCADCSCRAGV